MDKQQMLERIYEVIADKTLNFGCRVMSHHKGVNLDGEKYDRDCEGYVTSLEEDEDDGHHLSHECGFGGQTKNNKYEYKIIGHPVMIGDTLNRLDKQCDIPVAKMIEVLGFDTGRNDAKIYFYYKVVSMREDKRKPIDDQPYECIKFVYDLLPKE